MNDRIEIELEPDSRSWSTMRDNDDDQRAPRRARPLVIVLAVVALVLAGAAIASTSSKDTGANSTTSAAGDVATTAAIARSADPQPTNAGPLEATTAATEAAAPSAPATIRLGGQLLPTPSGLSVVAVTYSGGDLIDIDIDGRVAQRTELPAKVHSGPLVLAATGDWTWVRWTDESSGGSIVRAGQVATAPAYPLATSSPFGAFPGPGGNVWLVQADGGPLDSVDLVTVDGLASGTHIPLNGLVPAAGDDDGAVLAQGLGGVYRLSTGGVQRITNGELVAFGPRTDVVDECDDQHRCVTSVIDRASGVRRALGPTTVTPAGPTPYGTTSPDGAWAIRPVRDGDAARLMLIDLSNGQSTTIDDYGTSSSADYFWLAPVAAWSSDSRFVVYVDREHHLAVYDRVEQRTSALHPALPSVDRVAFVHHG